jgi:hypothetical protein
MKNRKIRIANHTDYTDYGFEVFLFDTTLALEEPPYNILVNIPFEKQDTQCNFVARASKYISENLTDMLSSDDWVQENRILYQE